MGFDVSNVMQPVSWLVAQSQLLESWVTAHDTIMDHRFPSHRHYGTIHALAKINTRYWCSAGCYVYRRFTASLTVALAAFSFAGV